MTNTINYNDLQDALEYIKSTCENCTDDGCAHCPLGTAAGFCMLAKRPKSWRVRNPETDVFRVLE